LRLLFASATLFIVASLVHAQAWPDKPVHLVVPYPPGGNVDSAARAIQPRLQEALGQPVIVDNKAGAGGMIGGEFVAKAAPDGYTLLMGPSGAMTMNPAIYSKLPYAPLKDFVPISMIGDFPLLLVVSATLPAKSVKDLIEYARSNPTAVNYSASAAPFQLAAELFNQKTGTKFAYIPYKSSGDSVNAVMSGQVTITITDPPPVIGPIKGGRVRALAVTASKRDPAWPEVPTLAEAGGPDIEIRLFTGFHAPAGTPRAIVDRLQREVARVVKLPEIRERLDQMSIVPSGNTSEEFRAIIARDIDKWTAVAKAANIKAD